MNENLDGPSKPGEGITWKVGDYAYVKPPHRGRELHLVEITKVGRRWAEVQNLSSSVSFKRFDMKTGLEDSAWTAAIWASPEAVERGNR